MNMKKDEVKKKILNGEFPTILKKMFLGEEDPFGYNFRDPHYVFSEDDERIPHWYLPLFENGAFTYFYDERKKIYVAFHLESPEDKHVYGRSIQCLWAGIILNYYDDETELADLLSLSEKLGFLYAEQLHEKMQTCMKEEGDFDKTEKEILSLCQS